MSGFVYDNPPMKDNFIISIDWDHTLLAAIAAATILQDKSLAQVSDHWAQVRARCAKK